MEKAIEVPKVTVIIPNYNHFPYLPKRIESVLNQIYTDFEVILMDDCSPDNSRQVIADYAAKDSRIRVVLNEQNSGSTFKQWNKGISLARGKYIWIAESDDYADKSFLKTLVAELEKDDRVGVAYCDSWSIDEENVIIGNYNLFYSSLNATLWTSNFVLEGKSLLSEFMSYRNIIPNASAAVIRKSIIAEVGSADETFRLNGDWVFWAKIFAISYVAFVSDKLNYFRQHTNNVRSTTVTNGTALYELTRVLLILTKMGEIKPYFFDKALDNIVAIWIEGMMEYDIPLIIHRKIYHNLQKLDKKFYHRFQYFFKERVLSNRMSGLRRLLINNVFYRIIKKRRV